MNTTNNDEFVDIARIITAAHRWARDTNSYAVSEQISHGFQVTSGDDGAAAAAARTAWSTTSSKALSASAAPFVLRPNNSCAASNPSLSLFSAALSQRWHVAEDAEVGPQRTQAYAPVAISAEWTKPFTATHHIVTVQNLEPRTTKKQLFDIFFPMGATDAVVLPNTHVNTPVGRRGVGVVTFTSADMAKIAAEKINDFVPHGQSFPLTVAYVAKDGPSAPATATVTPQTNATPAPSSGVSSSASVVADLLNEFGSLSLVLENIDTIPRTNTVLLNVLEYCVTRPMVCADDFAGILVLLLTRPQSTRTLLEDAVQIIKQQILSMGFHSSIFTPPLAGALQKTTERIEEVLSDRQLQASMRQNVEDMWSFFKRIFCQCMLQLLLNQEAEKSCLAVAGIAIGYLFDLHFLAGNPFGMAVKLMLANDAKMEATRAFLQRDGEHDHMSGDNDRDDAKHAPWINFVEALVAMTSSWTSRNPSREHDSNETEFHRLVKRFYGQTESETSSIAVPGSGSSNKSEHSVDGQGSSTRKTPPATPSSRPVPTSAVIARMSPIKPQTPPSLHVPGKQDASGFLNESLESNGATNSSGAASANTSVVLSASNPSWSQPQRLVGGGSGYSRSSVPGSPASQPSASAGAVTYENTLQKDLLTCTVYLTKLPAGLTDAKLRRLILHFGEFNKVRMYKEKTPPTIRGVSMSQNQTRGCFGFVEFAFASSAKQMIDHFRNASTTLSSPFHFLCGGDQTTQFTQDEIAALTMTRASYAKSAIHDQHPKDAVFEPAAANGSASSTAAMNVKVQPCMYGLPEPQLASMRPQQGPMVVVVSQTGMVFSDSVHFPSKQPVHYDACAMGQHSTSEPTLKLGLFDASGTAW